MHLKRILAALAAVGTFALLPSLASAQSTLEVVKKRGQLVCGVNGSLPGFSLFNAVREWEGLDVDYCRAVSAAVLGDATKVKFVTLTAQQRFDALAAGEVDMLARNSSVTLERAVGSKVRFAVVNYYDGQGFVVPKRLNLTTLTALRNGNICVTKGTTHAANIEDWFRVRRLSANIVSFDTQDAMYEGFFGSRCIAVSQDATALAATLVRSGKAADHMMLPEIISKGAAGRLRAQRRPGLARCGALDALRHAGGRGARDHQGQCRQQARIERSAGAPLPRPHARQRQGARPR